MPDKANPRDVSGTIVAFDFGLARIGAAVGNTLSRSARPVRIFPARTNADKWGGVEAILREWEPVAVVVGVPLRSGGERQELTDRAERFSRQIEGRFSLPVYPVDERFSSVDVEQGRMKIDDQSAAVILEQWFSENF